MIELFPSKLLLGPMAGVTDYAFRRLLREMGLEYGVSEMISAKGLCYGNDKTADYARAHSSDHPLALQLFGSDPQFMLRAALYLEKHYIYEVLDINMGCPVKKVVRNGDGSALMKDIKLAMEIVSKLVENTSKPVSVKFRSGISEDSKNCVAFAKAMEKAGASMVVVHGRTANQMYSGRANWDDIGRVKDALQIPVVGSGDITSLEEGLDKIKHYGVDAIMIARALRGNPFLVRDYKKYFTEGTQPETVSLEERFSTMRTHLKYLIEEMGEANGTASFRKHGLWYMRDFPGSAKLRDRLSHLQNAQELDVILSSVVDR
ncbi:MAG: tRNA dihydrouridine synthase DusB [Tissierellia bacterium]|nr:tRNA dihydrouridine synthase DusB [Tissierellia bacterium]